MSFKDLNTFLDATLRLPIGGKTYVVHSPDAKTGLWVQEAITLSARARAGQDVNPDELAALQLDDDQERDLYRRAMGATYDEMLADGVPWEHLKIAGTTVLIWIADGKDTAEAFWNAGGDPKARKQPTDRKRSAKSGRQGSPASSSSRAATKTSGTAGRNSSSTGS